MTRGTFFGLAGFALAGVVLAAVLGTALPGDWSDSAFAVTGLVAALVAGAAGGLLGAWQGPPIAAIGGVALGALALIATQPQADVVTLLSVLAVLAGATGGALALSRG